MPQTPIKLDWTLSAAWSYTHTPTGKYGQRALKQAVANASLVQRLGKLSSANEQELLGPNFLVEFQCAQHFRV